MSLLKRITFVFLFLSPMLLVKAASLSPSESMQISLLTCSPGKVAYEKFGHTAIRIFDPAQVVDVVFNYGVFSFETNNFYYKFIKGETDYMLGAAQTADFLAAYALRNSSVTEQVLNLTQKEKEKLVEMLTVNYQPENRSYRYNFVYDNCSTRARDVIMNSIDGISVFSDKHVELKTYREYVEQYVGWNTWLMFGIDIVFGASSDVYATRMTSMFLPEILMKEFRNIEIVVPGHNKVRPIVSAEHNLVDRNGEEDDYLEGGFFYFLPTPLGVSFMLLLLGIFIIYFDLKRKHRNKLFNFVLLLLSGLAGLIVVYLSFFSLHPMVQENYNLLWLNPLNLVAALCMWYRPAYRFLFFYFIGNSVLLLAALVLFALNLQSNNMAFIPLIVLLLIRSIHWIIGRKNASFKIILRDSKRIRNRKR